ncbi:MAG: 2-dehydropantoate 2-reductase N-terminal domain-containing protein, partial [Nitrospirota bacterium]
MRILVWGLGYVGTVSAACLARLGHEVIGIDPNLTKVEAINRGDCAIKEPGLHELIKQAVQAGTLRATTNGTDCILQADISLICVGTPSSA